MEPKDPHADAIHDAIQRNTAKGREAVLTGWVVVAEWMDEHGERWLTRERASSVPVWTASGLHHEALYGQWPEDAG